MNIYEKIIEMPGEPNQQLYIVFGKLGIRISLEEKKSEGWVLAGFLTIPKAHEWRLANVLHEGASERDVVEKKDPATR